MLIRWPKASALNEVVRENVCRKVNLSEEISSKIDFHACISVKLLGRRKKVLQYGNLSDL